MLKTLLRKDFLSLISGFLNDRRKGKRRSVIGVIAMAFIFLILFVSVGAAFMGFSAFIVDALLPDRGWLYMALIFSGGLVAGLFGSVFTTYTTIYKSKDSQMLLTMPIKPGTLLLSKMITVYLLTLLFTVIGTLPGVINYWIHMKPSAGTVLTGIAAIMLLALFTTALSCVLGWLVALVIRHIPNKNAGTVIATLAFMILYYVVYFRIQKILQSILLNIDSIEHGIKGYVYPIYKLGLGAAGDGMSLLIFAAISIVLFAIVYLVLSRSFLGIVTRTDKVRSKVYTAKIVREKGSFGAILGKEFRHFLGSPAYMLNGALGTLLMPAAAVFLIIKAKDVNTLIEMLSFQGLHFLIASYLPLLLGTAMCFISTMNALTAPSISLEGKSLWLTKSLPLDTRTLLRAKQALHLLLTVIPALILLAAVAAVFDLTPLEILRVGLMSVVFIFFISALGLMANLLMPNLKWSTETEAVKRSGSALISIFGSWGILIVLGALYIFLLKDTMPPLTFMTCVTAFFLIATVLMDLWIETKGVQRFNDL
ncbi:MAG: hypothetical protein IKX89_05505 [Firmicutes bacterium]|nr:hypothetical protein [Bacillota bacterium]